MLLEQPERPVCDHPGCNKPGLKAGISKLGFQKYHKQCGYHRGMKYDFKYRIHKDTSCSKCGFIAEHSCQLDVDHIDGNHKNNDVSNLQTLCANCHRLKTQQDKDRTHNVDI